MTLAPLRVLIIGDGWFTASPGGLNRYLADLMAALDRAGLDAWALVTGPAPDAPSNVGTPVDRGSSLLRRVVGIAKAANSTGRSRSVVDSHFALYGALPALRARSRHWRLVVHFHGPWADESDVAGQSRAGILRTKRVIERFVYRRADVVVVLSHAFAQIVVDRYGVDPARVEVIPPGVDLERFCPGDRTEARLRFGQSDPGLLAVTVRRLEARMGLDVLLDAWRDVVGVLPTARLVIAGTGSQERTLRDHAARVGLVDSVRFLGSVSDAELVDLYRAADLSIVPSRLLEGFGLSALESLACGTPVVVTDVGGLPEVVQGLDATMIVPPGDPSALAQRILRAANGEVPTAQSCRDHARKFQWDDVARRHVELYAGLSGSRLPRVVFVDHTAQLSGGELALARLLSALPVDARVVLAEDGPLVGRIRGLGIEVDILPMSESARGLGRDRVRLRRLPMASILDTARYSLRLARYLRRHRPDLVETNSLKAAMYGGLAARLVGIPVIWHVRDRIDRDYLPNLAVRMTQQLATWVPSAIIVDSNATLRTLGSKPATCFVVPSPIQPSDREAVQPPERVGLSKTFTVGMAGRLAPWKGQHIFIDAFARAFPSGSVTAAIIGAPLFGEEDYEADLHSQVGRLGLEGRVDFRGFCDPMDAEYERLDVLVHASVTPEPFGLVVVEGMARGLAVVAAAAGGPAEIITDGVDALLYPMGDVEALAERLTRLHRSPDLRARLGNAARQRAEDYSPGRVASQVMEVYRMVLSPGGPRSRSLRLGWRTGSWRGNQPTHAG